MKVKLKIVEIKAILARKSMSQNCFAGRVGITSGYMSQLMSGFRHPSPKLRVRILKRLKMDESKFDEIFEIKN